jgi:hypothetical protein
MTDSANGSTFNRYSSTGVTPSDNRLQHLFSLLKARGFQIEFKPGFWYNQTGWAMMNYVPADANAFFNNWQPQLVHYASLAQACGVDVFDVSYEQSNLTYQYASQWIALIAAVRSVYKGQVTANFQNFREAEHATFLNLLDFVEVSCFYKYVSSTTPSESQLEAGWQDTTNVPTWNPATDAPYSGISAGNSIISEMNNLYAIANKPILIGDIAFISSHGAAANWNSNINPNAVDLQGQSDQFEAFFKVFTDPTKVGPWFMGVTFLTWFPFDWMKNDHGSAEVGISGRSIRDKPAEKVVTDWYTGNGR